MIKKAMIAGVLLGLAAGSALAQSTAVTDYNDAARDGIVTSGKSDQGPGGLTAREIVGKRLLDSEGNVIGMIERVSRDGRTAIVRGPDGKRVDADMDRLGLGMGAHTVIEQHYSRADALNAATAAQAAAAAAQARQLSGSSSIETTTVQPPPAITTTTTRTETEQIRR